MWRHFGIQQIDINDFSFVKHMFDMQFYVKRDDWMCHYVEETLLSVYGICTIANSVICVYDCLSFPCLCSVSLFITMLIIWLKETPFV